MGGGNAEGRLAGQRKPPRTTCKVCWKSVYEHEEVAWVIAPAPGLAHEICARKQKKGE